VRHRIWKDNPGHPGLQFKLVGLRNPVFPIRAGVGYRALGLKVDDGIVWFWIGSHAEYARLISQLQRPALRSIGETNRCGRSRKCHRLSGLNPTYALCNMKKNECERLIAEYLGWLKQGLRVNKLAVFSTTASGKVCRAR
jgi:hypothetical protein